MEVVYEMLLRVQFMLQAHDISADCFWYVKSQFMIYSDMFWQILTYSDMLDHKLDTIWAQ